MPGTSSGACPLESGGHSQLQLWELQTWGKLEGLSSPGHAIAAGVCGHMPDVDGHGLPQSLLPTGVALRWSPRQLPAANKALGQM